MEKTGVWFLILLLGVWQFGFIEARGRSGGGSRSSGSRSSSRSRSSSSGSRTSQSRYYSGNSGRSSSSGGFGLGLGGGLLLGYSLGSGPSYGHGHGHNYGRRSSGSYDTASPISCYTGVNNAKISEDIVLDETLTECAASDDVCFGKVVLTVSNTSSNSQGFLEVEKGCGMKSSFETFYKQKATFNSDRQCFATEIVKNNRVVNNFFTDNSTIPVLSNSTSSGTSTSTQEELCICEGSKCNSGHKIQMGWMHFTMLIGVGQSFLFKLKH